MKSLADRVTALISRVHDANVNLAARDTGVPQPTLARIASGDVKSPRTDALTRISSYYRVSTDWLLTGAGELPLVLVEGGDLHSEQMRWHLLVKRLQLPKAFEDALILLPTRIRTAVAALPDLFPLEHGTQAARVEGIEHEHRSWYAVLNNAVQLLGETGVADVLLANPDGLETLLPPPPHFIGASWGLHEAARLSRPAAKTPAKGAARIRKR